MRIRVGCGALSEGMGFAGERGKCSGDFLEAGAYVGGRDAGFVSAVGVSGVTAGHGVTEVAFNPRQGGVAQLVGGDLLGGHPWHVVADAGPEVVVTAPSDGPAAAIAQQLPVP
jgi:hypothetical protein